MYLCGFFQIQDKLAMGCVDGYRVECGMFEKRKVGPMVINNHAQVKTKKRE